MPGHPLVNGNKRKTALLRKHNCCPCVLEVTNLNAVAQIKSNHIYSQIPKYIFGYLCTGEYKGNEKGAT